jgi:hypothetical protein
MPHDLGHRHDLLATGVYDRDVVNRQPIENRTGEIAFVVGTLATVKLKMRNLELR